MDTERRINPEQQLEILENLKPKLGKFFQEMVYGQWGLRPEDVRLVDEAGFGYTGTPIYGPELTQAKPHIDIAVIDDKYQGPRSPRIHPKKILFPLSKELGLNNLPLLIVREYDIFVEDLLKGTPSIFSLPTIEIDLAGTSVLIPEPVSHVRTFAQETILFYEIEGDIKTGGKGAGEDKIREWFEKLRMIRNVSQVLNRLDVQAAAQEAIEKSIARWASQDWDWLVIE